MQEVVVKLGKPGKKKVAVIGHERSGTHFLMNTLSYNFGYISSPWFNFDFELGINFHAPGAILNILKQMHDKPVLNILKSHHPFEFFADFIDYFVDQFFVFYIYRDPRDVMVSNWKLINFFHTQGWDEGPKVETIGEFIRSQPRGAMLRYQKEQEPTVLHRWRTHVEGWMNYAEQNKDRIMTIRYEDLNLNFEDTVRKIGKFVSQEVIDPKRPSRFENVIRPGKGKVGVYREYLSPEDNDFVLNAVGDTMKRLGYL